MMGLERADKRRMDELRVEVGVKESFTRKLVRRRFKRPSQVERMGGEKLAKRPDAQKLEKGGEEDRGCDGRLR